VKDILKQCSLFGDTLSMFSNRHSSINGGIMHCDKIAHSVVAAHKNRNFSLVIHIMFSVFCGACAVRDNWQRKHCVGWWSVCLWISECCFLPHKNLIGNTECVLFIFSVARFLYAYVCITYMYT
jgi:hypothetical protein